MRTLFISDLHCPFEHPLAIDFVAMLLDSVRPDLIINLGDEVDFAAFSRYAKDPDMPNGTSELKKARKSLRRLYTALGDSQVYVCNSNHTQRPLHRVVEAGVSAEMLKPINEILEAPSSWTWVDEYRCEEFVAIHGEGFSGPTAAAKAATSFRRSTVIAHVHAHAGVHWSTGRYDRIFGMNAGCLIDPSSIAFRYAKHCSHKPTLGCGICIDGWPSFIPMVTSASGRRLCKIPKIG